MEPVDETVDNIDRYAKVVDLRVNASKPRVMSTQNPSVSVVSLLMPRTKSAEGLPASSLLDEALRPVE